MNPMTVAVQAILEHHLEQTLSREDIRTKFRRRESFLTAQVFCVWLADSPSEVAVVGSSGTASDDGRHRPLALIVSAGRTFTFPLSHTAYLPNIIDIYGLEDDQ